MWRTQRDVAGSSRTPIDCEDMRVAFLREIFPLALVTSIFPASLARNSELD